MLDRLVHSWLLVVLGVKNNSSLFIVAIDHRQPKRWDERLAIGLLYRTTVCTRLVKIYARHRYTIIVTLEIQRNCNAKRHGPDATI